MTMKPDEMQRRILVLEKVFESNLKMLKEVRDLRIYGDVRKDIATLKAEVKKLGTKRKTD